MPLFMRLQRATLLQGARQSIICESGTLIYSLFALFVRASVFISQKIFSSAQERVQPSINHNFLNQQLLDTRLVFAFTSRERRGMLFSVLSVCMCVAERLVFQKRLTRDTIRHAHPTFARAPSKFNLCVYS